MRRYIKDYNGATMMECRIDKHIDYLGTRLASSLSGRGRGVVGAGP